MTYKEGHKNGLGSVAAFRILREKLTVTFRYDGKCPSLYKLHKVTSSAS